MEIHLFKTAWRNLVRSKAFGLLNMTGLGLGFAGFILSYQYINRERSYDAWNPAYEDIYLVGSEYEGKRSGEVAGALAPAIQAGIPEVVYAGRVNQAPFEVPFITDRGVFHVKKWIGADLQVAKMFGIQTKEGTPEASGKPKLGILSAEAGKVLYYDRLYTDGLMMTHREKGMPMQVDDIAREMPGPSLISFDFLNLARDLADGFGGVQNMPPVMTFIQLKPGADPEAVARKINGLYRGEVSKLYSVAPRVAQHTSLYLDPLRNLHLRPLHGSNTGYIVVLVIGILSSVILLLAAINYTNLMVTQANKRAKEIGLKKIFGVSRSRLAFHFWMEILVQCLLAAFIGWVLVRLGGSAVQKWLGDDPGSHSGGAALIWQLALAALGTALVSGVYPAIVLSGYRPVRILRGNFQTGREGTRLRHGLLAFQFLIAIVFLSSMFLVRKQLDFMRHSDKGFDPGQVVYIKNLVTFGAQAPLASFEPVRNRLKTIPGVEYATVATSVPGGALPAPATAEYRDARYDIDHIGIDYEYFETMGMELLAGRLFPDRFPADSADGVVINEAAMKALNIREVAGQRIRCCNTDLRLVGVVRDARIQGFDEAVAPTAYTIRSLCKPFKTEILVKIKEGQTQSTLAAMEKEWEQIIAFGDYFRYEFVDEKYAALFREQARLESAVSMFAVLAMIVAMMGLFSMSAHSIRVREKEMTIRKVLGASVRQVFVQLNKPFFRIFVLANLVAIPIVYILAQRWLSQFVYRIEIEWWIFAAAGLAAALTALLTVSWQAGKAALVNPVEGLRNE